MRVFACNRSRGFGLVFPWVISVERLKRYSLWDRLEIDWIDAQAEEGPWEYLDEIKTDPMHIKTVGYFLKSTNEDLVICRSQSCDNGLEGRFSIPIGTIKKVRKLRA